MRCTPTFLALAAATVMAACADGTPEPNAASATPADAAAAAFPAEQAAVLATVQRFFDAMGALDADAYRDVVVPEAMTYSVRVGPGGSGPVRGRSHLDHIAALEAADEPWNERFWEPTVLVHGPIALVWTPYDFHVGDVFSHCGIDAFELMRVDGDWKITNAQWTAEPEGCNPGPPTRAAVPDDERRAVLAAVQRVFDAMAAGDVDAYAATLVSDATSFAVRVGGNGESQIRMRTGSEEVEALRSSSGRWEERAFEPVLLVHAPLAVYWAPFEFYFDGEFSHCGVNIFQLMKFDDEWKLTTSTWTEETERCATTVQHPRTLPDSVRQVVPLP